MHIAILGTGDVGKALAAGYQRHGHDVTLGTRDPGGAPLKAWLAEHPGVGAATFAEAAKPAELVVLAVGWNHADSAAKMVGPDAVAGKILIDATNPLDFSEGGPRLSVGHGDSAGEQVQRWFPDARVVKCYNIVGNPHMVDPKFQGGPPTMFICGDDAEAKTVVSGLLGATGWDVADIGGIDGSRYLEPMAMVWIRYFAQTGAGEHAFRLLRKPGATTG